ncbi:AUGMIN subunit 3 [Camellia lanceoleosa]|uniref:AUGMIN subunit 3 n=1 Tax=Camellia lanceoleosa TaxID=1840588 RepID=A0ACC0I418_9ERIC|nr:AUGMIN subunit 3 [Camellia lanceoleosa]
MFQRKKFVEHNANVVAAGRVLGVDLIEQITKHCIRIVKNPENAERQLRQLQTQDDMFAGQASALIQGRRARVAATSSVLKNTNVRLKDTVN